MKRINNVDKLFMAIVIALGILYLPSCEKETDKPSGDNKVVLTPTTAGSPGYFNVNVSSSLSQTGGQTITDHGFCYSTAPNPDINAPNKEIFQRNSPILKTIKSIISGLLQLFRVAPCTPGKKR